MIPLPSKRTTFLICFLLIFCVISRICAGTIKFVDGTIEKGTVILVNSKYIRFKKLGSPIIINIPNEKVHTVVIAGITYSYNEKRDEWVRSGNLPAGPMVGRKGAGDDTPGETESDSVVLEIVNAEGKYPGISIKKYENPLQQGQLSQGCGTALDSLYGNNFYELCYKGYNYELTDEVYAMQDINEVPFNGLRHTIENPYTSGTANLIVGYCFLGWGMLITGVSVLGYVDDIELLKKSIVIGVGLVSGAGVSFALRIKRKREHERWEKKYD